MNQNEKDMVASIIFNHGLPALLREAAAVVDTMETRVADADYLAECKRRVFLLMNLAADISGE